MNSPQRPQVVLRYHSRCVPLTDILAEQILKTHCKVQVNFLKTACQKVTVALARGRVALRRLRLGSGTRCVSVRQGLRRAVRMLFEVHNFFLKISYSELLTLNLLTLGGRG
jgi:hypothetical protein